MVGKNIPLETWHCGKKTFKKPVYELTSPDVIKAKQDKLGENAAWYYGTDCKKCHGVYPAFFTERTFAALCYYVCLVCGKESRHEHMNWQARDSWNNGMFIFNPEENAQMTIFEFIGGKQ